MNNTQEQSPSSDSFDPQTLARQVALDAADEAGQVGDFVESIPIDGGGVDFRFACLIRGYEGWQWSVTLYHDVDRDLWTVDESSLIPTGKALRPPAWVPWKDRLRASDLSVTDSIGTEDDDPRLQDGFRPVEPREQPRAQREGPSAQESDEPAQEPDEPAQDQSQSADDSTDGTGGRTQDNTGGDAEDDDTRDVVEEFALSRRRVLSPLGRSQAAKRWYDGPHGPKSLSTKTADGNVCATCGFFVPLQGDLGTMFGVCANGWGPDDGRVVSLDHGCGEHSEIEAPEPTPLWVQSKPAFDDLHIDVLAQSHREERGKIELLELLNDTDSNDTDSNDTAETSHDGAQSPHAHRRHADKAGQ